MIGSAKVEMKNLFESLAKIQPDLNRSMTIAVKDAAKVVVRKAAEMTPPGSNMVQGKDAQRRGEKKIASDIKRVYATASYAYETIKNRAAASAFWLMIKGRKANLQEAEKLLHENTYNVRLKNAQLSRALDPSLHKAARKRGEVGKRQAVRQVITSSAKSGPIEKYIREKQKMVGLWASGWMPAVVKLKISKLPSWIKRHKDKGKGRCDFKQTRDSFEMIAANSTGFGSISRILPYAIAGARGAMIKQAEVLKAKAIAKAGLKK